ncbi:MAG TPA: ACT domain-containing protein [Candidatus Ratteibacteria bacterium]|nr:ACT domain-containing protein [Candidatus Ratteibacteria bacterium]
MITQLSIFLENRLGRLFEVVSLLGENNINIRALSLADKANYGILRIIVDKRQQANIILKGNNISVKETKVIAAKVKDEPGGLSHILKIFVDNGINVEYMYAFVEKSEERAIVVFRVENPENGEKILKKNNIKVLNEDEIEKF